YTISPENPPLARVAVALGPWLVRVRPAEVDAQEPRVRILSRLAVLPFFLLAGVLVHRWGGLGAAALWCTTPAALAHAGLATADMAFVAMALLALTALRARRGVGLAFGLLFATKFSALFLLPAALLIGRGLPVRRA